MNVRFTLSFPQKFAHLINVKMEFIAPCDYPIIEMPSWTPGSYLIREYARHVMNFKAKSKDGEIQWRKVTKNNWLLDAKEGKPIEITYQVYSYEMTVRTNYIDNYIGLLNGTATFFYPCDTRDGKAPLKDLSVSLEIIPEEFEIITALKREGNYFIAHDFDELFDSPIGLAVDGYIDRIKYSVAGIPCELAIIGKRGNHDIEKLAEDLRKIQVTSMDLFGELPYDRYVWLLYIRETGGGGLEHKNSNVSIVPRWKFRKREDYLNVLRLESHEHFHVYNVKRIRPKVLGPFDYSNEVYTTSLWIAEGLTNYYEKKVLLYGGIYSVKEFFDGVQKAINDYFSIPGRFETSIAESSFDAWIKLYRPNENSSNSVISYYLKGGLVGLLLDIEIREQTNWEKSLDDVFRGLYGLYKQDPSWGYSDHEFPSLIENFTGADVSKFYEKFVLGIEELPFESYFSKIGVELKMSDVPCKNIFGVKFIANSSKVKSILSTSPALKAGISPGDEIVSLNGFRFSSQVAEEIIQSNEDGSYLDIVFIHDGVEIHSKIENVRNEPKWQILIPEGEKVKGSLNFEKYIHIQRKN